MRIIVPGRLRAYAQKHPDAAPGIERFREVATAASWRSFVELRNTYNSADQCRVKSNRIIQIIDIKNNAYRLIVAIHFDKGRIYIRDFLTHAEYSKGLWKARH